MRLAPQNPLVEKLVLKTILATNGKSSTCSTTVPPTISNSVLQHTPSASSLHLRPNRSLAKLPHCGEKKGKVSSFAFSCKNRGQSTRGLHCQPSLQAPGEGIVRALFGSNWQCQKKQAMVPFHKPKNCIFDAYVAANLDI